MEVCCLSLMAISQLQLKIKLNKHMKNIRHNRVRQNTLSLTSQRLPKMLRNKMQENYRIQFLTMLRCTIDLEEDTEEAMNIKEVAEEDMITMACIIEEEVGLRQEISNSETSVQHNLFVN